MNKYFQNNDFFEKIDNERKAYWLGFLYADGCVSIGIRGQIHIILILHPKDQYIIEEFIRDLESNRVVKYSKEGYASLRFGCTKMGKDLIKLGCVPKKSNILKFPSKDIVPDYLLNHFIRGYMDGDGCISTYTRLRKNKKTPNVVCEIKFIGTYDMLYGIKKFFKSDKDVLINKHSPKSCQISFAGKKYKKYVDLLYKDATIYLKRKKEKWDLYKSYVEEKERISNENENIEIIKFDMMGNFIGKYSIRELRERFDINAIKRCCRYREKYKSYNKFRWMFSHEYEKSLQDNIDIKDLYEIN